MENENDQTPITELLLVQLGFKSEGIGGFVFCHEKLPIRIQMYDYCFYEILEIDNYTEIKYVHELETLLNITKT
jgi:hypothetical protein